MSEHRHITDRLLSDSRVEQGFYLTSRNREYHLIIQNDGNLVVYRGHHFTPEHAVWAAGCHGKGSAPYHFRVQEDGNLVVYDGHGHPIWASNTHHQGHGPYEMVLGDDGKVHLHDHHKHSLWTSH